MFQLVFKGECASGTDPAAARANAATLFKASVEQVERMFSGQPVVIRNKLEEDQALKYRAVLARHGMVAYVQPMPATETPAASAAPAQPPRRESSVSSVPASSTPAPAGTGSGSGTASVEPGDRLPVAGDKVDTILAGSGLALDPAGVTLAEHQDVETPMFQHLDQWTLAPAGTDLGVERDQPPPVVPDVSHLSLADEEPRGNQ